MVSDPTLRTRGEVSVADIMEHNPITAAPDWPLERAINGYRFVTMRPPSSGGVTMFETLEIIEALGYDFANHKLGDNAPTHQLIEGTRSVGNVQIIVRDPNGRGGRRRAIDARAVVRRGLIESACALGCGLA